MNAYARQFQPAGDALRRAQDRLEALEAEVADLRRELGLSVRLTDVARVTEAYRLSDSMGLILLALHAAYGRWLSAEHLMGALEHSDCNRDHSPKAVCVYVHKIRRRVGADTIASRRTWLGGYSLTEQGKRLVDQALERPL